MHIIPHKERMSLHCLTHRGTPGGSGEPGIGKANKGLMAKSGGSDAVDSNSEVQAQKRKRGFNVHLFIQKYILGKGCQTLLEVQYVVSTSFHLSCQVSRCPHRLRPAWGTRCNLWQGHLARATGLQARKYGVGLGPVSSAQVKWAGLRERHS